MLAHFRSVAMRMVMNTPSFYEGVRAVIIDKDNKPKWQPSSLTDVPDVSPLFQKFTPEENKTLSPELFDVWNRGRLSPIKCT